MTPLFVQLTVEVVPPASLPHPAPLDEGLEEGVYLRHIAPPPPAGEEDGMKEGGEEAGQDLGTSQQEEIGADQSIGGSAITITSSQNSVS